MRVRLQVAGGGVTEWIEVEAANPDEAVRLAGRSGARIVAVETPQAPRIRIGRSRRFPLLIFAQELLALLEAGLHVVEAVETLRRKETDHGSATVLDAMLVRLHEGRSFSEALTEHSHIFPMVLVASVAASEQSGSLPTVVERFIRHQLQLEGLRRKVVSSAIYPLLLLAVGFLVTVFLLGYVVPKFSVVLTSAGREPTGGSRLLLEIGSFLHTYPIVVALAMTSAFLLAGFVAFTATGREKSLALVSRLPAVARLATFFALTRFYRTAGTLLDSGIPLIKALAMTRSILPTPMRIVAARAEEKLKAGERLSEALAGTALLPPIAESLLSVGERSGKLAEMMNRTASFLEDDLSRRIELFSRVFEPLLMAIIGLVIGTVVVLMYMPIFDLVGSFG